VCVSREIEIADQISKVFLARLLQSLSFLIQGSGERNPNFGKNYFQLNIRISIKRSLNFFGRYVEI